MLRRETLVCDTIEEETGIAIKKEGTPEPPASSKPNWSSPNPQVAEFERQKLVIPFRPDQPEGFDLRIGQFVGQSDRHLGQPEFAGGFKPEMPVNNRAVRFGHDRNPEPEFPNSGGHLINLGVILARIARVFNRPIDRPLLDLQWTCQRRRRLFYRVHLIGAKGEGGGCGIQWISTSPATLPKLCADRPDQVASAWEAALAADRPVVVEFKTDPEVPPLPPHITLKQAKAFVATLWKGDPEESGVIVGTARQVLSSILPGGSDKK